MTNRNGYSIKRWMLRAGISVLVLGVGFPFLQATVLPAAFGLGTSLLWIVVIPVSLIVGIVCIVLGLLSPIGEAASTFRLLFLLVGGLHLSLLLFLTGSLSWNAVIGPSAKIIIPNEFKGHFLIVIDDFTEPSLMATAGRKYLYKIPENGKLRVDQGWIALHFAFEDGYNVLGRQYMVQIVRRNGTPLKSSEFDCMWLAEPVGQGIDCDVQPLLN